MQPSLSVLQQLVLPSVADGSLAVYPSLFRYGNDIVERNRSAATGFDKITWVDTSNTLVSGLLSRYFLYASPSIRNGSEVVPSPTITRIQIWRPAGAESPDRPRYTLVWERRVLLNTTTFGLVYTVCMRDS